MTFQVLPVNIVGESYKSRSLPLSAQATVNLLPEVNKSGRTKTALQNFLGSKAWTTGAGADRGSINFNGTLYVISGNTLYSVSSSGAKTSIGTIAGTDRCMLASDSSNLIIVTGSTAYQYDGATLSAITDADLENPNTVTVINNQAIYDGNNGRWVVATAGDPDDIPAINYAVAESNGDDLLRVHHFNQTLYLFGSVNVETWYNSGTGSPPFTRIEGGIIEKGLHAVHSVANTTDYIYFLDSDKKVSRAAGYQLEETITPPAIAHQMFKMTADDAVGMTMNVEGQNLYVITFPTGNKTFAYSETFDTWFELSYGVNGGRHLMNSYQFVYGKRLITDYRNGNIYELDAETFTDNGEVQLRQRVSAPINGISLGLPGSKFTMEWFELFIETGIGLATGQGSEPEIMFYTSVDGGRTFDAGGVGYISAGESGDYVIRVRYDCMIEFQELLIKIQVSDPVFLSIHGAAISVQQEMGY